MSTWLFDATLHVNPSDDSLHVVAYDIDGRAASFRFSPAKAMAVKDWLKDPQTWADLEPLARNTNGATISYSHDTGQITLTDKRSAKSFDPHKDEDMAKLVRVLKTKAKIPRSAAQPSLPGLPVVTELDLKTKRQIFTKAMPAGGVKGQSHKAAEHSISDAEAKKRLSALMLSF